MAIDHAVRVTVAEARALRVDGQRLWSRLMDIARFGATANGGCNRQALTDQDIAARARFIDWCAAAGCEVRVDAIGNLFARREGRRPELPAVLTGSHLDTQPTGGRFDGIYGVLAGLEVIETLNAHAIATLHPVEIAVWCNEEGCRFPAAMMGSAVWSGRLALADAYALADRSGATVRGELLRAHLPVDGPLERQRVKAAFEAHIEQGPVLQQQARTIGVVTGVLGMRRYEVRLEGQEAHAGPTPMDQRRDPVRALAEILPGLYRAAERLGPEARLTIGIIEAAPGSPNTIPGSVRFTVDVRHPEEPRFRELCEAVEQVVAAALAGDRISGRIRNTWEAPGVRFDTECVATVRRAAAALGYPAMDMVSGAGHDSVNVSYVAPTAMLFVPCAGGLSHNEAESAAPADLEAGGNVLLHAVLAAAVIQ